MEKVISKPWGCEIIWAQTKDYTSKLLFVKEGCSLPLQYHELKEESLLVSQGRIKYHWYQDGDTVPRTVVMCTGDHVDVPTGRKYRIEAIDHACVIEVTTSQGDDVVYLRDAHDKE